VKSFSPPNLLRHSLIGAVGLGIALLGIPQSATAVAPFSPFEPVCVTAELEKPYSEIEYQGVIYPLVALRGGHRGTKSDVSATTPSPGEVVAACQTNPPVQDPITGTWTVPVTNNFINFSTDTSPFGKLNIGAIPGTANGYLEFVNNPSSLEDLDFPVNSIFTFRIKLELPDLGVTLFSAEEVKIVAENLTSWAPLTGTVYHQSEFIDLIAEENGPTIARLSPDRTIITSTQRVECVPEPLTILGSFTALSFGATFKKKRDKKN
jgi:hypothetical protein